MRGIKACIESIQSGIQHIFAAPGVEACQHFRGDTERELLFLARCKKAGLGKARETPVFLVPRSRCAGGEQKQGGASRHAARVAHACLYPDAVFFGRGFYFPHGKVRIAQSIAERVTDLFVKGVKIPVSHINAVFIEFLLQVSAVM